MIVRILIKWITGFTVLLITFINRKDNINAQNKLLYKQKPENYMTALLLKELKSVFCSVTGIFFSVAFLVISGLFLWFFAGKYNIPDSGYADLKPFFSIAPIIFIVLIPALTMRMFAEEKRSGTFSMLRSYPVGLGTVWFAKLLASLSLVILTLAATFVYVWSLYELANPAGNTDLNGIIVSYLSLTLLSVVFIAMGLFASAVTSNQIVALIAGIVLCAFSFYGFELIAGLFSSGRLQSIVSSVGLLHHYSIMQQGIMRLGDIFVLVLYLFVFWRVSSLLLGVYKLRIVIIEIFIVVILVSCISFSSFRVDLTADKRYTISNYTKNLLEEVKTEGKKLQVNVYLDGDLNPGFTRLRDAAKDLLHDLDRDNENIRTVFSNPYALHNSPEETYQRMNGQDMPGIVLNEVDREGRLSRKVIYPYAQVIDNSDTLVVSLLKNVQGYTAEENLNASVENLEYEFADAISLLTKDQNASVAFIEGHGEIPRPNVFDAEELLSKYYSVHRGHIGDQVGILDDFEVVIIAGPKERYTEQEKYVLDQYIMSGGRVLWLVDGAYTPLQEVYENGQAASMKLDVNLDDMLFTYGVRINPDLVQDRQSASVMLIPGEDINNAVELPCYYMPLLMPSPDHIITRNIRDVKAAFGSSLDFVSSGTDIKKTVLLTTSGDTHLSDIPLTVTLDVEDIQSQSGYFDQSYVPMGVLLEGSFTSVYQNRMSPELIMPAKYEAKDKGKPTKMIVVSSSEVIRNELEGKGADSRILPMGYDRVSGRQLGNRDFIVNAVNWLAGNEELMALRAKKRRMYLLNKTKVYEERDKYAALNIGLPVLFVLLITGGISLYRKRKYER